MGLNSGEVTVKSLRGDIKNTFSIMVVSPLFRVTGTRYLA